MCKAIMEVIGLSYSYDGKNAIFQDLDLKLYENEVVRLCGKNGIGKSTLLKIMVGLIEDNRLRYKMRFEDIETSFHKLRSEISFVLDTPELFQELTGLENIKIYDLLWKNDSEYIGRVKELCKKFEIDKFLEKTIEEYSLGMQHKLFLAITLARNAKIYLMDEPFNALDIASRDVLVEYINNYKGATFVIVSHLEQENLRFSRSIDLDKV